MVCLHGVRHIPAAGDISPPSGSPREFLVRKRKRMCFSDRGGIHHGLPQRLGSPSPVVVDFLCGLPGVLNHLSWGMTFAASAAPPQSVLDTWESAGSAPPKKRPVQSDLVPKRVVANMLELLVFTTRAALMPVRWIWPVRREGLLSLFAQLIAKSRNNNEKLRF